MDLTIVSPEETCTYIEHSECPLCLDKRMIENRVLDPALVKSFKTVFNVYERMHSYVSAELLYANVLKMHEIIVAWAANHGGAVCRMWSLGVVREHYENGHCPKSSVFERLQALQREATALCESMHTDDGSVNFAVCNRLAIVTKQLRELLDERRANVYRSYLIE